MSDLFSLQKTRRKLAKENLSSEGKFATYSSETANSGIIGYTDNPEFICDENTPVYLIFGDHTRTMNVARRSFSVLDNVKVLVPCVDSDEAIMYMTAEWKKQIPNLGYARHWKVAKDCLVELPIQTDATYRPVIDSERRYNPEGFIPDWDFMERYIRAVEKIVIAETVMWKDEIVSKTRGIIA